MEFHNIRSGHPGPPAPERNGFLWAQISRFTPSAIEIWLRQTATGQINFYELESVGSGSDNVSGLQDRQAFSP
jgi:hypothetical protein